jgi:hypothetical protein
MEDWQAARLEFFRLAQLTSPEEIAGMESDRLVGIVTQRSSDLNFRTATSPAELVEAAIAATGSQGSPTLDCPHQEFNTHVISIFRRTHRISSLLEIENAEALYPGFLLGATILMIMEVAQNTEAAKDLTWRLELSSEFLTRLDDVLDTPPLSCSLTWVLLPVLIDVTRLWGFIINYCRGVFL